MDLLNNLEDIPMVLACLDTERQWISIYAKALS